MTTLAVGADLSWSETLRTALDRVPVDYVLLWIDDHFVIERVNNADIMAAIKGFLSVQGNYLRLHSLPKADERTNEYFGTVVSGAIYRTATVASVWRRSVLKDLLKPGESAWDFETAGSLRSDAYEGFYSTWRDCFRIENLLIKGRIRRSSRRRIECMLGTALGIQRPMMTRVEESRFALKVIGNRMLIRLPRRLARVLRTISYVGRGQC